MKRKFNLWPFGIVLLLVLFFIGIMSMVVIASSQHFDLVSENYYAEELGYQKQIDGIERAKSAGASLRMDAAKRQLMIELGNGAPTSGSPFVLEFYRPSAAQLDWATNLQAGSDGRALIDVSKLEPGLWKVRVLWEAGGKPCLLEGAVTNVAGMPGAKSVK